MRIIQGDLTLLDMGIIAHQVNCQGVMGAGLAKNLAQKYPKMYLSYKDWNDIRLGGYQLVNVGINLYIANCVSQEGYGRDKCYTDYEAVNHCFKALKADSEYLNLPIFLPYNYGCGLAGGDWTIVSSIIELVIPKAFVVQYNKGISINAMDEIDKIVNDN